MSTKKRPSKSESCSASLTVPELDQSKTTVLNTLASVHSRRSYKHAIEKFIAWFCSARQRAGDAVQFGGTSAVAESAVLGTIQAAAEFRMFGRRHTRHPV
jgi:hypothetical protein